MGILRSLWNIVAQNWHEDVVNVLERGRAFVRAGEHRLRCAIDDFSAASAASAAAAAIVGLNPSCLGPVLERGALPGRDLGVEALTV